MIIEGRDANVTQVSSQPNKLRGDGSIALVQGAPSRPISSPKSAMFINRELSWLEFNARVLHEAIDARNPLLERVKFLSIFSSNLDEFYMVRVAGLRRQIAARISAAPPDGLSPSEQIDAIQIRVGELISAQQEVLHQHILPELAVFGVRLLSMKELDPAELAAVQGFFDAQVFPVLTPLAIDPGHPFPYISNLSISLAVEVRDPEADTEHFARVKVPKLLPRWIPADGARPNHFVPLESVIEANLAKLFPGMEINGCYPFRITRYSDLDDMNLEEPEDLLASIEEQVFRRKFAEVVRLEVTSGMPARLRDLLVQELREETTDDALFPVQPLGQRDVQTVTGVLDLGDLMAIANLDLPELRDPPLAPTVPAELKDATRSMVDVIRERDVLVHHPFDSFTASVERFLEEAASDDQVLAIKLTLYRTSGDTAIVRALTEAAQQGKQVAVLVELKARFDEVNNIAWARTLESFGVHVTYGLPKLKTHSKTALVVRREADGIRRYVHIGTGNYNSRTARVYTDLGLFTSDNDVGADLSDLFNSLTGFSRQTQYRRLLVAPGNMRERFLELIERERGNAKLGIDARIVAKMNALVDAEIIQALYAASQAGVAIDLVIRGICCLRPGIDGMSERIRVRSIVGRFLEHSRLWYFENAGRPEYFMGSADWMPRNLDRRVEAVIPIQDKALHPRLWSLLNICLSDNRQAWDLQSDGRWIQRAPGEEEETAVHKLLLNDSWGLGVRSSRAARELPADKPEEEREYSAR
jgi:polyphosphate kinase